MPITLDAAATDHGGVTLVTAVLRNEDATDRRVQVANALDGPLLAPRRDGVVADGWDGAGYEGVVPAGETVALGYACLANACEEPCRVAIDEPVDGGETTEEDGHEVADAVRDLGDPRPPAAGVPTPFAGRYESSRDGDAADRVDARADSGGER